MEKYHEERIQRIMAEMDCPKDFECAKTDFKNICKVTSNGLTGYVRCSPEETKSAHCRLAVPFGGAILCRCPVRVYLARNLHI